MKLDPKAGKDWRQEEKGATEDEMIGWDHWLNGHEFEQTLGDSEGQESLACCCPWGHKESDMTERLNNNRWGGDDCGWEELVLEESGTTTGLQRLSRNWWIQLEGQPSKMGEGVLRTHSMTHVVMRLCNVKRCPAKGTGRDWNTTSPLLAKPCLLALGCISLEERLLFIQRCLVLPTSYAHGAVSAQRRPFPSDKGTKGQPGTSMPWGGEERASIAASPPSGSDGDCSILSLLLAPLSSSLLWLVCGDAFAPPAEALHGRMRRKVFQELKVDWTKRRRKALRRESGSETHSSQYA